jgi:hypothetical protein
MSWNIQKPGDYINGPLTVTGDLTVRTDKLVVTSTGVGFGTLTPQAPVEVVAATTAKAKAIQFSTTGSATYGWIIAVDGAVNGNMILQSNNNNTIADVIEIARANGGVGIGNAPVTNFRLTSIGGFASGLGGAYIETGEFNRYGLVVNNSNASATTNLIEIRKASVALAAFTASGNLAFGNGLGIDFSAAGNAAGMTSELLNDYEEGTWTPTVGASTGTPTTVTVNTCKYTKIGRQVTVTVDFVILNKGTASGALLFTLPFSSDNFFNVGSFRENGLTGNMGQLFRSSASDVAAFLYNNSTVWFDGYKVLGTYTYCV